MGATVVRTFLDTWEPETTRAPLVAMVRSAMTNEVASDLVREHLVQRIFGPITEALGVPDARLRATLVGTQLIGLAMARYITRIEPLASAPARAVGGGAGADDPAVSHGRPERRARLKEPAAAPAGAGWSDVPRAQRSGHREKLVCRRLLVAVELPHQRGGAPGVAQVGERAEQAEPDADGEPRLLLTR